MLPPPDGWDRAAPPSTGGLGIGGGVLVGLLALACPLFCVGPVLVAGLVSTGVVRALGGASWPVVAGTGLVVLAVGLWGLRARGTRGAGDRCAPRCRDWLSEVRDEDAR